MTEVEGGDGSAAATAITALVPYSIASPFAETVRLAERRVTLAFPGTAAPRELVFTQRYEDDGRGGTELGFGASVYGGAIALAWYISTRSPELVAGRVVVELGCGLGLVSLSAVAGGARRVVATDGDAGVVALAAEAARRNLSPGELGGLVTRRWLWGDAGDRVGVAEALRSRGCGCRCAETAAAGDAVCCGAAMPRGAAPADGGAAGSGDLARDGGGTALVDLVVAADVVAVPYAGALRALGDELQALLTRSPPFDWAAATAAGAGGGTAPASSPGPVLLLAYQQRHGSEMAWFRRVARWAHIECIDDEGGAPGSMAALHPDLRRPAPLSSRAVEAAGDAEAVDGVPAVLRHVPADGLPRIHLLRITAKCGGGPDTAAVG